MKKFFLALLLMMLVGTASAGALEVELLEPLFGWDATFEEIHAHYAYTDPLVGDNNDYLWVFFHDNDFGPFISSIEYNFKSEGTTLSSLEVTYSPEDDMNRDNVIEMANSILSSLTEMYGTPKSTTSMSHEFRTNDMEISYRAYMSEEYGGSVTLTYSPYTGEPAYTVVYTPTDATLDFSIEEDALCGIPLDSSPEQIFQLLGETVPGMLSDDIKTFGYSGYDSLGNEVELAIRFEGDTLYGVGYAIVLKTDSAEYTNFRTEIAETSERITLAQDLTLYEYTPYVHDNFRVTEEVSAHFEATDNFLEESDFQRVAVTMIPLDSLEALPDNILAYVRITAETAEGYLDNSLDSEGAITQLSDIFESFPNTPGDAEYDEYAYLARLYVESMDDNIEAVKSGELKRAELAEIVASMRARFGLTK